MKHTLWICSCVNILLESRCKFVCVCCNLMTFLSFVYDNRKNEKEKEYNKNICNIDG
jgi:hypothetical protein